MNNELLEIVKILNSELLWIYFIIINIVYYGLIALLTWDIKKPLMYVGIPAIIVGSLLIIIRFSINFFLPNNSLLILISSALKPLLIIGIVCILVGIIMIVGYKLLNKMKKNKESVKEIEV